MNLKTHDIKHTNNYEELKCKNPKNTIYVDDCYGIVMEEQSKIWRKKIINI